MNTDVCCIRVGFRLVCVTNTRVHSLVYYALKFPAFYGTQKFFVVFRTGYHLSPILSQINQVALPLFKPILVFSLRLCLGLPSGMFFWGFIMKTLCAPIHVLCICNISCPSHPPWFVHPHNIGWRFQTWSSCICSVLNSSVKILV